VTPYAFRETVFDEIATLLSTASQTPQQALINSQWLPFKLAMN
jgi:hypothetical protein